MRAPVSTWLFGGLHIELRNMGMSDVLRQLQRAGVPLYEIRMGRSTCTLVIVLSDFRSLHQACRANGCRLRVIERFGAPFIGRALLRRKSLFIGFVVFLGLILTSTSMVWKVSVSGVPGEDVPAVLQAARDCGLYVGAWKSSIGDLDGVQQGMLDKLPSATWVGLQVTGTKAHIEVVEKIPGVTEVSQTPHNIVIAKPGVIRRVIATRGQVMVKPGQLVQPGQIAISGDLGQGAKHVAAAGQVLAEVWYQSTVEIPLQVTQAGLTGDRAERSYLQLGPLSLRVWGWAEPHFKDTVERESTTSWHIGGWTLPFQWRTVDLEQVKSQPFAHSTEQAEQSALQMAAQDVERQMAGHGSVLGQSVLHRRVEHGKLYETVMTRTEEDIGVAAPIASPPPEAGD